MAEISQMGTYGFELPYSWFMMSTSRELIPNRYADTSPFEIVYKNGMSKL